MPKTYIKTTFSKNLVSISKAAKFLQVSPDTLRNWEREGKLLPSRTSGGARRYSRDELVSLKKEFHPFIAHKKGLVGVSDAAKALKISSDTLRNWDKKGLVESQRSKGGARRFTRDEIKRLQEELGVENVAISQPEVRKEIGTSPLLLTTPKSSRGFHNFFHFWLRATLLIVLVLCANWFVGSNISPLEKKVNEISKIATEAVKSIESLQRGVLGIQTHSVVQGPVKPSGTNLTGTANSVNTVVFASAKAPLTFDNVSGQVGCISCLTNTSLYISSINNTDGTLALTLDNNTATISLDLNHANTWTSLQTFKGGIGIGTDSTTQLFQLNLSSANPVVMTTEGNVGIGVTTPINKLEVAGGQTIGAGYAGVYTAPSNGLLVQGNVGIGISAPSYNLDVAGGARFGCNDTSWDNGPTTKCSDVAELYQSDGSVGVGEIVVAGHQNVVTKSGAPYQKGIIGVYSTSPGLLVGGQTIVGGSSNQADNKIPVALVGRVPVKVSDENGPIQIGDYLTSSSIPGVAMKATKPGPVIGQALEQLDFFTGEPFPSQGNHLVEIKAKFGTILAFINVSYADPRNILAALTLDDQGNLIIPKLKAGSIVLDPSVASASPQLAINNDQLMINTDPKYTPVAPSLASNNTNFVDLSGEIASLEERIKALEVNNLAQQTQIKDLQGVTGNVGIGTTVPVTSIATSSGRIASQSGFPATSSAGVIPEAQSVASDLNLTPPDILLATGSATMADFKVTGTLSSDKLFTAQDSKISGDLSVFGKTILAGTNIAGDLTVDGTLSINGNSINSIGAPSCSEEKADCGILYLQNSPLAYQVNFFNGLVTIDKTGILRAQTVIVAEFKTIANKISGSAKIAAGTKSVDLENPLVKTTSRILITPTSETDLVLAVTEKSEGKKFTVSAAKEAAKDIIFDWFMVNESPE